MGDQQHGDPAGERPGKDGGVRSVPIEAVADVDANFERTNIMLTSAALRPVRIHLFGHVNLTSKEKLKQEES
jgi:hypothetical protein